MENDHELSVLRFSFYKCNEVSINWLNSFEKCNCFEKWKVVNLCKLRLLLLMYVHYMFKYHIIMPLKHGEKEACKNCTVNDRQEKVIKVLQQHAVDFNL